MLSQIAVMDRSPHSHGETKNGASFLREKAWDIRMFGLLLVVAGVFDLIWISAYPNYALKVFGSTFGGVTGEFVKYQHPLIHWVLGYGFGRQRLWAFYGYLFYLAVGCLSEVVTQLVGGFHSTRTTMIGVSLVVGSYIVYRRSAFYRSTHPAR
jgi:hypothetical protein